MKAGAIGFKTKVIVGDAATLYLAEKIAKQFGAGVTEAPIDGNQYARKDGYWTEIDETIDVPIETISKNGTPLPITAKNVDITVPTKTSELEKDDVYTKTEINNKLSAVYKYKGSVLTYDLLPTDAENADVWNVTNGTTPELNGMNYAWNSTLSEWDELGGIIGLATLTENGLMSKEDFAALEALKIHNHSGQSINPDNVVLNKEYTDIEAEALSVGAIFYNVDQKCWLLKLSSVNYYNFGEEMPMLSRIGDNQNHLEGQACFISGGSTQLNNVSLSSSVTGKLNCLATQDVLNTGNKTGYYCYFGQVRKFPYANVIKSTDNAATWVDGADLYLCSEAGRYSTVKESAPAKSSYVGRITNRNGSNITVMFLPIEAKATTDLSDWDGSTNAFADAEKLFIRKSNGVVQEITKADFYSVLDDYFAKLSGGNTFADAQNFDGRINHKAGEYFYTAASKTADTVNDTRVINSAGVEIHQICTVANAAKGGGTWVEIYRIANGAISITSGTTSLFRATQSGGSIIVFAAGGTAGYFGTENNKPFWVVVNNQFVSAFHQGGDVTFLGKQYTASSLTADTINDRRTSVVAGVKIEEICTLGNATKGGGTWKKNSGVSELGGQMIGLINKTGAPSIKGTLVNCSNTTDNAFSVETSEFDTIGVVYESGIADGAECWVVISGIAQVLLADGTASTRGYWTYADAVDGRANATLSLPSGGNIAALENHFKEIGHCLESKAAGTNVLAKVMLHFN